MLEVHGLSVNYGGIQALKGIDLMVPAGQIVTLVGANGAGKSSTLRAICGLVKVSGGQVVFKGQESTHWVTTQIVQAGITLVPEGRRVFADLTVLENLRLGAYSRSDRGWKRDLDWVFDLFPRLKERKSQLGGTLSGGEQQMLALGRALMANPSLLLMDEPSLGLAPILVQEIFNIIKAIHSEGKTILLIEQNARAALQLAHFGYVLETGSLVLAGTGSELLKNDEVKRAYLGEI